MTAADTNAAPAMHREYGHRSAQGWFSRAEGWLDERGKPAWIGAIVLGFIAFWPIGLFLLFYMLFFRKQAKMCNGRTRRMKDGFRRMAGSSGNSAFDAYKSETLRRLEEEQDKFEAFLERLREAKDKAEFDQFMEDRARRTGNGNGNGNGGHDDDPHGADRDAA